MSTAFLAANPTFPISRGVSAPIPFQRGSFAMASNEPGLTDAYLRTPRAAALAGIIFSLLLFAVFGLMRLSVPPDPHERGAWLAGDTTYVTLAMNLVPFAGIA